MICGVVNLANAAGGGSPDSFPPVAQFSPDDVTILAGTGLSFADQSAGEPTSWEWTINGIVFSYSQNTSYYFGSQGTFVIQLTASNSFGSDSISHTVRVTQPSGGDGGGVLP